MYRIISRALEIHGIYKNKFWFEDRLRGLVIRIPATDPEVQVRFPALPDFLRSSGSGTGSTQPRGYNRGATLKKKCSGSGLEIREYGHRDPSRWPRSTLYPQKLALNLPTSGGRSRTQATEFFYVLIGSLPGGLHTLDLSLARNGEIFFLGTRPIMVAKSIRPSIHRKKNVRFPIL
jgi:hypothetical protein